MELRRRIAALGAVLVAMHICTNAAGCDSFSQLVLKILTDPRMVQQAISLELTGQFADLDSTPIPSASPTPTSAPTPAPTPTPQILEALIAGGIRVDNSTDYSIDTAQLLTEGPSVTLQAGQPQILIVHTHSSEAYTMDDFDRYESSDSSRTQDVNYNVIR